ITVVKLVGMREKMQKLTEILATYGLEWEYEKPSEKSIQRIGENKVEQLKKLKLQNIKETEFEILARELVIDIFKNKTNNVVFQDVDAFFKGEERSDNIALFPSDFFNEFAFLLEMKNWRPSWTYVLRFGTLMKMNDYRSKKQMAKIFQKMEADRS